jgi:hypothetical protein
MGLHWVSIRVGEQPMLSSVSHVAPLPSQGLPVESRMAARARRRSAGRAGTEALLGVVVLVLMAIGGGGLFLAHRSDTAAAPTTTTRQPLVTQLRPFVESPSPGENYTDPNGLFRVRVNPNWERRPAGSGSEAKWYVRSGSDRFRDSVTTRAERIGSTTLDAYVSRAVARVEGATTDYELVSQKKITLASGGPGAVVVYDGTLDGTELRFLLVVTTSADSGATAALVSQPDRFDEVRQAVEPFLLTLQAL